MVLFIRLFYNMWYILYYDSVFCDRSVRIPGMPGFESAAAAQRVAAKARGLADISYIVLPY